MQSTALSTLIGYITGPKAEEPVGIRVVEPPHGTRQHQRGNLYVVAEIVGDHPDIDRVADHLLNTLQRSYYTARGSQSQVMLEAVNQAQRAFWEIQSQNDARDLSAGILCAALLGGRLMVVSVGAAFALVRTNDQVHMFPSELKQHKPGNMGQRSGGPEIFRQDVRVDDALFIGGGNWLSAVPVRTMASIVAFTNADTCSDAADELYEQSGRAGYAGLLIVFAPGASRSEGGIAVPGSPPPTRPRRPRFGGLPTAVGAPPPIRTPSQLPRRATLSSQAERGHAVAASPTLSEPRVASIPNVAPAPMGEMDDRLSPRDSDALLREVTQKQEKIASVVEDEDLFWPVGSKATQDQIDDTPAEIASDSARSIWSQRMSGTARTGFRYVRAIFSRMLPDSRTYTEEYDDSATDGGGEYGGGEDGGGEDGRAQDDDLDIVDRPTQWDRNELGLYQDVAAVADVEDGDIDAEDDYDERLLSLDATLPGAIGDLGREEEPIRTRAIPGHGAIIAAEDAQGGRMVANEPFSPPAPARGARARLFTLIALVILVIVPVVVAAITWERGASLRAEADQLTQAAEGLLIAASAALDLGDRVTARQKLVEGQEFLSDAIAIDGSNELRSNLAGSIESELQEVLQIKPLYALTSPLLTFPAQARPQNILVVDEDIFLLDAGQQMIVHYQYDSAAGRILDEQGQIVVRQGDSVEGVTVGVLADMAWLPLISGYEDRPSLLILDRNNHVYQYDQRVEGIRLLNFASETDWRTVGQIQTYLGRIYIGDEGTGDIYRYAPGQYETPPQLWFSNQTPVNLSGMVSMEIDGDIWLLFSNGMILRYSAGEQVPFSLENSIGLAKEPVDLYVMNQERTTLYLVDAGEDRILVYDKDGSYLYQLRAPEENLLRGLRGLFIDEVGNTMYILTQTALFTHPLID